MRRLLAAVLLSLVLGTALADGYSTEWSYARLENDKAQIILADSPELKTIEPWYAYGEETYYKSPGCAVYRELYVFSKPQKSSPGIWRGKRTHLEQIHNDVTQKTCNDMHVNFDPRKDDTASFIDPDQMQPDGSDVGLLPGVFLTDPKFTDEELVSLSKVIPQILACLKKQQSCSFEIEQERTDLAPSYMRFPALKLEKLESISSAYDERGEQHYEIRFGMQYNYPYQVILDIFHKSSTITKVVLTGPMLYFGMNDQDGSSGLLAASSCEKETRDKGMRASRDGS